MLYCITCNFQSLHDLSGLLCLYDIRLHSLSTQSCSSLRPAVAGVSKEEVMTGEGGGGGGGGGGGAAGPLL